MSISDSIKNESGSVPSEYNLWNLQLEWGLTTEEFNKESFFKIYKILEYKQAEIEGQKRRK